MSDTSPKTFWGLSPGTIITLVVMIFGFGGSYNKLQNAVDSAATANTATAITAHAEAEAIKTDFEKYVADHAALARDRLEANTAAQTRVATEIAGVRKDVADNSRKIDQHEFRITNTEAQQNRLNTALERLGAKIESLNNNVILLVDRLGIKPANDVEPAKQP
jgi:chromosome segregation ATPase